MQAQNHTCLHIISTQSWKTMYTRNDCKIKVKKSLAKHYKTKNFQKIANELVSCWHRLLGMGFV